MSFIASVSNKPVDNFDNHVQNKKASDYNSKFSDMLDRAKDKFEVGKKNSNNINKNGSDDKVERGYKNLDDDKPYNKDDKEISKHSDDNLEKIKNSLDNKDLDNTSNLEDDDKNKLNTYDDILQLLELEAGEKVVDAELVNLNVLIEEINAVIEQINTDVGTDSEISENIENILNALEEIKSIFENISSGIASQNQVDFVSIREKFNTILSGVEKNINLAGEKEGEHSQVFENVKSLINQMENALSDSSLVKNLMTENTSITSEHTFASSLESAKENAKDFSGSKTLDIDENNNLAQSSETISDDKMTEFTIVKAKSGVSDIVDNPFSSKSSANTSGMNNSTSIDILNKFQDMITRIVERAKMTITDGKTEMVMSLKPEHLGNVRMKMTVEGENLYAKVFVDNAEVKDIFTKNLDTIISSLKELNVSIEGFDVSLNQNSDNSGANDGGEFSVNNANTLDLFGTDSSIDTSVSIATELFPERKLNIVI